MGLRTRRASARARSERVLTFKHVLTQEVANLSLIGRTRQAIHRRITNALEAGFQPLIRGRPELLAHHLTESREIERATALWLEAGRRAIERSANAEAIAHLTKGLELLDKLPDSDERTEREIAMLLALGIPLQSIGGPASAETEEACRCAGRAKDGLTLLAKVPDKADCSGRVLWDAEFDRLRGEMLLTFDEGNQAEAEAYLQNAVSTAQRKKAKSLELRSATSLARLWVKQGKNREALDLLAPIYAWFTEGHDTQDLVEAKKLLDALSR